MLLFAPFVHSNWDSHPSANAIHRMTYSVRPYWRIEHNIRISYDSTQLMNENWHIFAIPIAHSNKIKIAFLEFGTDVVDVIFLLRLFNFNAIASTSAHKLNNINTNVNSIWFAFKWARNWDIGWMNICANKDHGILSCCSSLSIYAVYDYVYELRQTAILWRRITRCTNENSINIHHWTLIGKCSAHANGSSTFISFLINWWTSRAILIFVFQMSAK